jgi:Ni,Fe-hydrogenase maturation factor
MTVSSRNPPIRTLDRSKPVVVIGIGSPHGDDRAGWEVIDRLAAARSEKSLPASWIEPEAEDEPHHLQSGCVSSSTCMVERNGVKTLGSRWAYGNVLLHKATVPHDVLDWLQVPVLTHIIDASCDQVPDIRRFAVVKTDSGKLQLTAVNSIAMTIVEFDAESLRSHSSHQLDLMSTLELSAVLGTLPRELYLWTVSVASVEKCGQVSKGTQVRIDGCARAIAKQLGDG